MNIDRRGTRASNKNLGEQGETMVDWYWYVKQMKDYERHNNNTGWCLADFTRLLVNSSKMLILARGKCVWMTWGQRHQHYEEHRWSYYSVGWIKTIEFFDLHFIHIYYVLKPSTLLYICIYFLLRCNFSLNELKRFSNKTMNWQLQVATYLL